MANIFSISRSREAAFERFLNETGKERKTTFMSDFTIADLCGGIKAVKDTYNNVIRSWKDDVEYMAELVIVLNHKIWEHYEHNESLAKLYNELWIKTDDFCRDHFTGKDLSYYFRTID